MARVDPLPDGEPAELADAFAHSLRAVGVVTNNLRVMARKPAVVKALMTLFGEVMADGETSRELRFMVAYMASFTSGCMYCTAHSGLTAARVGAADEKLAAIWEYETSPLFSDAERAALRVAQLAAQVPNGVTDEDFAALKRHFSDTAIVELVAAISLYGFFNRFNDTMAMPLEMPTLDKAATTLTPAGWQAGRHKAD